MLEKILHVVDKVISLDSFLSTGNFSLFQIELISLWVSKPNCPISCFNQFCWNFNTWWFVSS